MAPLRSAFLVILYAVLLILAIPLLLFCALAGVRDPVIDYGKWAMRVSRVILRIKLEVVGLAKLDPGAVCIFMPNHLSFMDGPLVATVIPWPVRIVLKKVIFGVPVLGVAMRYVGFIAVDRKGAQDRPKEHGAGGEAHEDARLFIPRLSGGHAQPRRKPAGLPEGWILPCPRERRAHRAGHDQRDVPT